MDTLKHKKKSRDFRYTVRALDVLGSTLDIHTNHKLTTSNNINSQKVIRWRSFLKECNHNISIIPETKPVNDPHKNPFRERMTCHLC